MVGWHRSVAFGQRSQADIMALEFAFGVIRCQGGKRLAGVNLPGWRDWFDPRRSTDMRAAESAIAGNQIDAGEHWTGVLRDSNAQIRG